jgi:hypothetical protein
LSSAGGEEDGLDGFSADLDRVYPARIQGLVVISFLEVLVVICMLTTDG